MSKIRATVAILMGLLSLQPLAAMAAGSHFDKVPNDTPLYVGTLENENWLASFALGEAKNLRHLLTEISNTSLSDKANGDEVQRFAQLMATALLQGGEQGEELIAQPGRVQLYMQGSAPVLRLQLTDGKLMQSYLLSQSKKKDAAARRVERDGQSVWAPLANDESVFAAVDDNDLVLVVRDQLSSLSVKELVSGGQGFDPKVNVRQAMADYDLDGSMVAWIDLLKLQHLVSKPEHDLHQVLKARTKSDESWQQLMGEQCQADISKLLHNTPHLIGVSSLETNNAQLQLHSTFVWPLKDQSSHTAWQNLQGVVPAASDQSAPAVFGLGLRGAGLPGYINHWAASLSQMQCPLWREQMLQAGASLAVGGAMSSMFGSVNGLVAHVYDTALQGNGQPSTQATDARVSVFSDSPSLLLLMLRGVLPLPADIPADGSPVPVQGLGGAPMHVALSALSVDLITGSKALRASSEKRTDTNTVDGLLSFNVDAPWVLDKRSVNTASGAKLARDIIPLSVEGRARVEDFGLVLRSTAKYAADSAQK